jgi:hypothetical protein
MRYEDNTEHFDLEEMAKGEERINVLVRFPSGKIQVEEAAEQLVNIKKRNIVEITYVRDMKAEELGKLLAFIEENQGKYANKKQLIGMLTANFSSITCRKTKKATEKIVKNFLITLNALELLDANGQLTIYGKKLLRYFKMDPQKYKDYLGWLVLSKGGWMVILMELDDLYKSHYFIESKSELLELLSEKLQHDGYIKGRWNLIDLINWLIYLDILKQWDKITKVHQIDWKRVYELLRDKALA